MAGQLYNITYTFTVLFQLCYASKFGVIATLSQLVCDVQLNNNYYYYYYYYYI